MHDLTGLWKFTSKVGYRTLFGSIVILQKGDQISMKGFIDRKETFGADFLGPSRHAPIEDQLTIQEINPPVKWRGEGYLKDDILNIEWHIDDYTGKTELHLIGSGTLEGTWYVGEKSGTEKYTRVCKLNDILQDVGNSFLVGPHIIFNRLDRIKESVTSFINKHPYHKNVFIMMRYKHSKFYEELGQEIKSGLERVGLLGHFAKDKMLSDDLWENISIYMLGCKYGIAVFEGVDETEFNPNVSLELGFMFASGKRCLVLKDRRMPSLPTDICGRIYRDFDIDNLSSSIHVCIEQWASDLEL